MGMSKSERQIFAQLQASLAALQNPASNPAQNFLTDQSIAGANYFNKGDYSTLPKGMFFDFQMPGENIKRYKQAVNVGQGGTFALANNSGRGMAQQQAGQYLNDRFARDAGQNYQDNIARASGNVRAGLAQAAGAKSNTDSTILSALTNMYQKPSTPSGLGSLLGGIGGLAAAI